MSETVFKSINPYTQELLAEYPLMDDANLEKAINSAAEALPKLEKFFLSCKEPLF